MKTVENYNVFGPSITRLLVRVLLFQVYIRSIAHQRRFIIPLVCIATEFARVRGMQFSV